VSARLAARLAALGLVLASGLGPALAAAQLGLDLSEPDAKPEPKKKDDAKKDAKKKDDGKKPPAKPAPAKAAPAQPAPVPSRPDLRRPEPRRSEPAPAPAPTAPAPTAPAPRANRPADARPAAGSEGLDLRGRVDARPRLDAAKKLLDARSFEAAALSYDEILREPGLAEAHDEARYQLAKALEGAGLHHAALTYLDEVLERGPTGSRFFHSALERLFVVGQHIANEQPLLSRISRFARDAVPTSDQDRAWFLLAKYEFERAHALEEAGRAEEARTAWREARRLAGLVRPESGGAAATPAKGKAPAPAEEGTGDVYARAQFVDGLALYALGEEQAATEKFKDVVRLTNPKKGRAGDGELRELAFLQLARIHYQNRQNRYAIFYYGKMPWGGPQWLEGLWEASYAHYRIGEHEKALGNLLTLQSAYFKDEYFPESWVLKAIIYYENCRYPEARLVLEDFNAVYEPLYDELTALTARSWAPESFLAQPISAKVRKLAFTEQNIRRLAEAAQDIDAEVERGLKRAGASFRDSPLGKSLQDRLAKERRQLLTEAGLRARGKLEYERDQLRSILAQAERIRIEVSRQEREALEGSLAAGSQVEVVKDLRWTHAVSDEHLFWPYEGEFWRDELGTYSYTLTKGCKDRPPRSGGR
jgi:hypothetical protein